MPELGTVYRSPSGLPMLYVRSEQRPGAKHDEHLFVLTQRQATFQRWEREVPEELELIVDKAGRAEAEETRWLLAVAKHDKEILTELLKQACDWLPAERGADLRRRWVQRQPPCD